MSLLNFVELPELLRQLPLGEEKNIGIYGLGIHTKRLLDRYRADVGSIKAKLVFIDSYKQSLIEKFDNCDIYNVRDIGGLALDAVILSSSLYENEMYQILQELYAGKFRIYRFYELGQDDIFEIGGEYVACVTPRRVLKVKFVDFWESFIDTRNFIVSSLQLLYRLEYSGEPDVLFCSHFGDSHKKYKNCIKIFIMTEVLPVDFGEYDYVIGYQYMDDDRFFHYSMYAPQYNITMFQDRGRFTDPMLVKRKFCNFVYSNEKFGEGAVIRKRFCVELGKYRHIDCPGKVLNNMEDAITPRVGPQWRAGKVSFIEQYKFTIAFENHMVDGYTTEKLYDSFIAGSIPIYWGNPLIGREIEPDAFINCNDFDNDFDAVIKRVIEIDADDEYYMYMLGKSPFKSTFEPGFKKLTEFLYTVIEQSEKKIVVCKFVRGSR